MTGLLTRHKALVAAILLLSLCLTLAASGVHRQLLAGTDKTYEELKLFSDILDIVEKNYVDPVDPKDLIEGAIHGMLASLDPHSSFLSADTYNELQIDTKGEFSGIGIVITMKENILTVVSPIEGTPAHEAGIKSGDQIIKVDGETTKDMKLWEAVKRIRGQKGTPVLITVRQKGLDEPKDLTIVRDVIPLDSVHSHVLKPGYGYLRITNFRDNTYDDAAAAINELESGDTPLKGLVLDLRDNPGGLLDQSVKIADIFLEKGVIVSIKGRSESEPKTYSARPNIHERTYPIVLLINEGSASASEIVAGALQDHGRALVLGATSFGKGSVQAVEPLRDGYGLKLTIARYYTPEGHAIQAEGIKPDVVVEQRFLPETETPEIPRMHEKDLKNHISAEPQGGLSEEEEEEETDPDLDVTVPGTDPSEEVKELLDKDQQVGRALDILAGWEIFSKMSL
ncbi:MAG: S41 family peptidase [Thermodesulfobacteriota bacterium]|nr:S41 family peptidase [Thermodesulfobacteriota bacterium]